MLNILFFPSPGNTFTGYRDNIFQNSKICKIKILYDTSKSLVLPYTLRCKTTIFEHRKLYFNVSYTNINIFM